MMNKNKEIITSNNKIKVCNNIQEVKDFIKMNKEINICLYLAYKEPIEWEISTSRVYMNKIHKNLVYLPINIKKNDFESLKEIYDLSEQNNQIVAINQTQPHKSNSVLKEWFRNKTIPDNVDSLIKDQNNKLTCYDLNGPSFTDWFTEDVSTLKNRSVILLGVGGVGEPIARRIAKEGINSLYLIDINSKDNLAKELSNNTKVTYLEKLNEICLENDSFIFINCTGKEGGNDNSAVEFLQKYKNMNNIFVDLRPQINIEIVNLAKKLGWDAYTGFGMNARNDYTLLKKISELINIKIPSFEEFKKLVEEAS